MFWSRFTLLKGQKLKSGCGHSILVGSVQFFGRDLRYYRPKTYQMNKVVWDPFVIWNTLPRILSLGWFLVNWVISVNKLSGFVIYMYPWICCLCLMIFFLRQIWFSFFRQKFCSQRRMNYYRQNLHMAFHDTCHRKILLLLGFWHLPEVFLKKAGSP